MNLIIYFNIFIFLKILYNNDYEYRNEEKN